MPRCLNLLRPRLPPNPIRYHTRASSSTTSSSPSHHNLPTFLSYARTTSLSRTSTLFIGTHYEYTTQLALSRLGFHLTRTGARNDLGIDLVGTWQLPSLPFPVRVVVQCKAVRKGVGPNLIRELEGSLGEDKEGVMGVLVAMGRATKGVRDALGRSGRALGWVVVESEGAEADEGEELDNVVELGGGKGKVRQILWNKAARDIGLEGVEVGMRYQKGTMREAEETEAEEERGLEGECVLMWKGKVVEDVGGGTDHEI